MKKLLFILCVLIVSINSIGQDVVGSRIIAKQSLFVKDNWVDSLRRDTINWANDFRTLPTTGAVYKFVAGRMGSADTSTIFPLLTWERILANEFNPAGNGFYNPVLNDSIEINMSSKGFFIANANDFAVNLNQNEFAISGNNGGSDNITIIASHGLHRLRILNAISNSKFTEIRTVPDSLRILPDQGRINIDSLRSVTDTVKNKPMTWNVDNGMWSYLTHWPAGSGGGVDSTYVDSTFIKVASYTADQKRGDVFGTRYSQTGFADLDTFTTSGVTPTISNSMIVLGDGSSSGSSATLNRYTMLTRWTLKAGFKIGQQDGDSYGFNIGMASVSTSFIQNFLATFSHRSTPSSFDGFLYLYDGEFYNNLLATSTTAVGFSVGDSIEVTLTRNVNIFTFIARNVTTGGADVSVSYTYTLYTTAVNTASPIVGATGIDSLYHLSFYSDESTEADLITVGDSKLTWYGNTISQAIPSLMYGQEGTVINHSGSGDKTAEVLKTTDEIIDLNPRQALLNVGSNDIRAGVASGTWQANIDTIYNRLTDAGIEVYFALMYETDIDQSPLITYLQTNYSTRYIPNGYEATLNCGSCLQSDGIHLTAYGNAKWTEAVAQSGMIDFLNPFREMKFTEGDPLYPEAGDSLIINKYFSTAYKLNVNRGVGGLSLQWEAENGYEANSYERRGDTIILHGVIEAGERFVIQTYSKVRWVAITPEEPEPVTLLLDSYPGAAAAFSTGLLRTGQTQCLRVRRDSDNTEQDIGFDGNDIDETALLAFVGGGDGFVVTFYDQSGNGRDATQSTQANQPRIVDNGVMETENGKATLRYLGGSQSLNTGSFTFAQPTTHFIAGKNDGTNDRHFVDGVGVGRQIIGVVSGNLAIYAGIILNFGANNTNYNLHTALFNSASSTIARNGAGTVTGAANTSAMSNGIRIGSATGASGGITGCISAAVFYDSNQTTNMTAINNIINAYFTIY